MKRTILAAILILAGMWSASALSLSSQDMQKGIVKWYELSDNYSAYDTCVSKKNSYNQLYPSYRRSDCFGDSAGYKYFICPAGDDCTIAGTVFSAPSVNTSTPASAVKKVPNQEKLDVFLSKVKGLQNELGKDKYEKFLNALVVKLDTLGKKYQKSAHVSEMVAYLSKGVEKIKADALEDADVDGFFCELGGNCERSTPTPIIISPVNTPAVVSSVKKSCKLVQKTSVFEGDNNGYAFEAMDGWYVVDHLSGFSDGNDGYALAHGQTIRAMRVSGKAAHDRIFRCNDGVPEYSGTESIYGDIFCNDPNYTIDGFTVAKMLKKSGAGDLNGGYQYFKMNVGDTYRQAYAKCDHLWKVVIMSKKEYPKSWNCERGVVVDGITIPKFIRPSYQGHAADDSYDFLDSYILDGQSFEFQKASSSDGNAYNIKVRCEKGDITIIEKVRQ